MTKPDARLLGLYILRGQTPVRCLDLDVWVSWMGRYHRQRKFVRVTEVAGITVSTVFLGLDHSFSGLMGPEPILFETAFLEHDVDGTEVVARYATWDEAVEGHKSAVKRIEAAAKLAMEKLGTR